MYINSLKIKNLRCFRETELKFQYPDQNTDLRFPNINLLLGTNGSGKSTLLRAISLAILYPVLQGNSGLKLDRLVRQVSNEKQNQIANASLNAEIILHSQDSANSNRLLNRQQMIANVRKSGDIEELFGISESPFFEIEKGLQIPASYRKRLSEAKISEDQTVNYVNQ